MSTERTGISIVICCYNSATRLPPTLKHLAEQQLPVNIPWEVVLVDNACTDNTIEIASKQWDLLQPAAPLRIVNEYRPGTDHARRAGVFAAGYRYILFCDDDNWLAPDYLATAINFLDTHPNYALVGGQAEAVADEPFPDWFFNMSSYYAACAPAPRSCELTGFGLWSAGMAGRTATLCKALHAEHPLLLAGRVGSNTGFGEDSEICMRVALQGFKIWYSDKLRMKHWMAPVRLTNEYRDKFLEGVTMPAIVKASYFRAWHLEKKSVVFRHFYVLYHCLKWIFVTGDNENKLVKVSDDFIYYGWGIRKCRNEINSKVKTYLQYLKHLNKTL